jgi:hypothetical protein
MKELIEITANTAALVTEDGLLTASAEVILIWSEPHYKLAGDELVKERHTGTLRLGMSPERMRQFATGLINAATVIEAEVDAAVMKLAELNTKKP